MKPLKLPSEDKAFNTFANRLAEAESKVPIETTNREREETDSEKERECAALRDARIEKLTEIIMMSYDEAVHRQRAGVTDYELQWELEKSLRVSPPELRYQYRKRAWHWHETSYWYRGLQMDDGQGCNHDRGCVPECRFYPETGRVEDEEVIQKHHEHIKMERERIQAADRKLGISPDDSDEVKRDKWAEIHALEHRISKEKCEYLKRNQHTWQSSEDLKAIEDAAWAQFYDSKKNKKRTVL